ncbi:Hypothetical protein CINCED_3A011632, partial [Cinara cedri]
NVMTLGLCLPSICKNDELSLILKKIFNKQNLMMNEIYNIDYKLLRVSDLKTNYHYLLDWKSMLTIIIIIFTILMMIFGTIYDVVLHRKNMKKLNISNMQFSKNNDPQKNSVITNDDISKDVDKQKKSIFGEIILCFSAYTNIKLLFRTNGGSEGIKCIHGLKCILTVCIIIIHAKAFTDISSGKPKIVL